jgi:hypothetical protein
MILTLTQEKAVNSYCQRMTSSYYDIEQEIKDHILTHIETGMEAGKSFEMAFAEIKDEFTPEVIADIIGAKKKILRQKLMDQTLREFLSFFTWPKIGLTALLVVLFVWLDQKTDKAKVVQGLIHLINLVNIGYAFGKGKEANRNIREKKRSTLSMSTLYGIHLFMTLPAIVYLIISLSFLGGFMLSRILIQAAFYACPVVLLLSIAWQNTYVEGQLNIRKLYPGAFGNYIRVRPCG